MADDWRVTVNLDGASGRPLAAALLEHALEQQARAALGERVAVGTDSLVADADRSIVFLYAGTQAAAEEARRVVESILETDGKTATFELDLWHPLEEKWEPAEVPLPVTEADRLRERKALEEQDAADTAAAGYAQWEVRLDLPSHGDAVALATRLEAEGLGVTRRWKYLLVGAASEDDARALAKRLPEEAPPGAEIQVQPGGEMVWETWQKRPFAWFGDTFS
jgi:hypothetical protein